MRSRYRRIRREVVCWCRSYSFPHRLGGGRCHGDEWAQAYFWNIGRLCSTCNCFAGGKCEVSTGQESVRYCEAAEDAKHYGASFRLP